MTNNDQSMRICTHTHVMFIYTHAQFLRIFIKMSATYLHYLEHHSLALGKTSGELEFHKSWRDWSSLQNRSKGSSILRLWYSKKDIINRQEGYTSKIQDIKLQKWGSSDCSSSHCSRLWRELETSPMALAATAASEQRSGPGR